jgi:hypothetical protein
MRAALATRGPRRGVASAQATAAFSIVACGEERASAPGARRGTADRPADRTRPAGSRGARDVRPGSLRAPHRSRCGLARAHAVPALARSRSSGSCAARRRARSSSRSARARERASDLGSEPPYARRGSREPLELSSSANAPRFRGAASPWSDRSRTGSRSRRPASPAARTGSGTSRRRGHRDPLGPAER